MIAFKRIGLIGRGRHRGSARTLQRLVQLLTDRGLEVLVEQRLYKLLNGAGGRASDRDEIGRSCDLAIAVGGDGSMLSAARDMSQHDTPVLGVNRGRLGFLTDISPDDIEHKVAAVLDGEYQEEQRFLLEVLMRRDGEVVGQADALNDVVVNSGTSAQMIEFDLHIDDNFVYRQRSDGLIVATPTGSTAYSLSGGGPIMHPALDAIVLVPMFPHSLSSRPITVVGNSRIRIEIVTRDRIRPSVTCDGQVSMKVLPGDLLEIYKKADQLRLIQPLGHDFYASCRDKLRWSTVLVE